MTALLERLERPKAKRKISASNSIPLDRQVITLESSDIVFLRGHCPLCAGDAPFHLLACPLHVAVFSNN